MSDFNITLFEACELLNRSKKSISRYIRRGLLHPEKVKSQQGTLEYRFTKADIEAFKVLDALETDEPRPDGTEWTGQTGHKEQTRQTRQDTLKREKPLNKEDLDQRRQDTPPDQTGHNPEETGHFRDQTGHDNEVISLLKETTGLLKDQLKVKDEQIKDLGGKIDQLIERDRETNIILKGLQDKVYMLGQGKAEPIDTEADEPADTSLQDLADNQEEITETDKQLDNSSDELDKQGDNKPEDTPEAVLEPLETAQEALEETGQDEPIKTADKRQDEQEPVIKGGIFSRLFK